MWITEFRDPDNTDAMISAAKVAHKLTYIFLSIVIFTIANFFFAPAVSIFYQWKSGKAPTEFVYVLPYLVKLPLDLNDSVQHAIAYVPVTICSVSLIFYISGIDAFYCLAIQHLVLHLQLLQRALIKLRLRSLDKKDKTKLALDYLRLCVEKHQAIIKHSYILEQIYSPIIFGLGVVSTLSMCMVTFHAIVTKGGHNGNVALFIVYFSMEFSEVLLYCWFGSSLIFASLEVGLALYDIDWYNAQQDNEAFPTCVHIMMIRIQKPIKLTALKFADVSLILFTNIMSTTASYFALLKTLYTS
ncbi:odorant receptor 13a-like [Neodiprion pinetum]|uniref:odorant receptor 13a-like n=1 Tax=Neodiprion pinetum TaxID=441929 RepID=UPI0037157D19